MPREYVIPYTDVRNDAHLPGYYCWLNFNRYREEAGRAAWEKYFAHVAVTGSGGVLDTAKAELVRAAKEIFGLTMATADVRHQVPLIRLAMDNGGSLPGSFTVTTTDSVITVSGTDDAGVLYGVFHLLRSIGLGQTPEQACTSQSSQMELRLYHHWDMYASGEALTKPGNTGIWAGRSIFFKNYQLVQDMGQIRDYARLLASVSINAICLNNNNVPLREARLLTEDLLPDVARIADTLREYGVRLFLCISFASPMMLGGLATADPLDDEVIQWWRDTADTIYRFIPDFGGFIVKADSEGEPGPFTYGRDHVQGANMLARALGPHGGLVVWRAFVYDCHMDWRDRTNDRAKYAYECFVPLDGQFDDNVILMTKHGPIDFQPREPLSPTFAGLKKTSQMIEYQIVQEYTGRQTHICYLVPMLKECLDFDTYSNSEGSTVTKIVDGSLYGLPHGGITGVANICDDEYWTSHPIAQANFYGFGRLAWDPDLTSEQIAEEWIRLTFGDNQRVKEVLLPFMLESRTIFEGYTAPLGIGWMVVPYVKYGPDVDGYEYSPWGTYHYADRDGIGVDRTLETGTGYVMQYNAPVSDMYNNLETCPDELLLFFHHVPYTHVLHSGKTVIQHIYDSHFESFDKVVQFKQDWLSLAGLIDDHRFALVCERLDGQIASAREWRDVINTYFYRKSGIADAKGRLVYS